MKKREDQKSVKAGSVRENQAGIEMRVMKDHEIMILGAGIETDITIVIVAMRETGTVRETEIMVTTQGVAGGHVLGHENAQETMTATGVLTATKRRPEECFQCCLSS